MYLRFTPHNLGADRAVPGYAPKLKTSLIKIVLTVRNEHTFIRMYVGAHTGMHAKPATTVNRVLHNSHSCQQHPSTIRHMIIHVYLTYVRTLMITSLSAINSK